MPNTDRLSSYLGPVHTGDVSVGPCWLGQVDRTDFTGIEATKRARATLLLS
jgi:hypothetical protein